MAVKTRRRASNLAQNEAESSEPPTKRIKVTSDNATGETSSSKRKRTSETTNIDTTAFPKREDTPWKVGAHVSAAGGVENAVVNALEIGANAFALFLKSQRKWTSPALSPESAATFKQRMVDHGYSNSVVLPHGSYLINLGNPDSEKREKSYTCLLDDLKRCEELGLELYNFHPGSTVGETTPEESISLIAQCINRAHRETKGIVTVIETMPGAGNQIGGTFAQLGAIIAQVEDKSRVGVCIDTCHIFSAGYDIRNKEDWEATIEKFDAEVGLSYLRGMHLNDSKAECGSKKDLHENIGLGRLSITAFYHIMNDPRMQNIPLVLETPSHEQPETWAQEIKMLNSLSGLDLGDTSEGLESSVRTALLNAGVELGPSRVTETKRGSKARGAAKPKKESKAAKSKTKSTAKRTDSVEDVWSDIIDEDIKER